jgi:hypothetical protein
VHSGQALVELALALPVLLAIVGVMAGILWIDIRRDAAQNGIEVLTRIAATDPGWQSRVVDENRRTGCNANPLMPTMTYGKDTVIGRWSCWIDLHKWGQIADTVEYEAVLTPTPAPKSSAPPASPKPTK